MADLYRVDLTVWLPSERIDDVLYTENIGDLWSDEQLAAIGLFRPQPPVTIPSGMRQGSAVELVDGVVRYALEEIPAPGRRLVSKAVVEQRLIAAGLMDAAFAALSSSGVLFARWYSRASDSVYADDPDALALLASIGAEPEEVMAP